MKKDIKDYLLENENNLLKPPYSGMNIEERLLHACLCAYKKHVKMDDCFGWNELGNILHNAICESIGDIRFMKWNEKEKD